MSATEADLLWMRKGYDPFFKALTQFQLLNHIPNERRIINKGFLTEHLQNYSRQQSHFDFSLEDFYQETYCLRDADQSNEFLQSQPDSENADELWILKPSHMSRGRGIRIISNRSEATPYVLESRKLGTQSSERGYIAQRYIRNPLLLDGRKSEIRIYWLIACLEPLQVLLYREGTVRLNSLPFKLNDFENQLIHVTNVYQQENHPDFDPSIVLKWTFDDLESYVTNKLGLASAGFIENQLKPALKKYLAYVVHAARDELIRRPNSGLFFGLFGADLILDDQLRPWLTEVQKGPGLSLSDPVKQRVIPPMLEEAVFVELEIQRRLTSGESLKHLERVRGFEWVINEA